MSLNELLDLKRKPWCNVEVEDLYVDGTFFYHGSTGGAPPNIVPFEVGPTGTNYPYQTIQSAIDSANATSPTDQFPAYIYVYPGTYTENLTLYGGILIFGLGDDRDSQLTLFKFGVNMYPFDYFNNAVMLKGANQMATSLNSVIFNNITFLSNPESNMFTFGNSISGNLVFNSCNLYTTNGVNAFSFKNLSKPTITLNNSLCKPIDGFTNIQLMQFEASTESPFTGAYVQLFCDNSTIDTLDPSDLVSGSNSIDIFCTESVFGCSFNASLGLADNIICRGAFINSSVACSGFFIGNTDNTPIFDGLSSLEFTMVNCYNFNYFGTDYIAYRGPFVNNITATSGLTLNITDCYFPLLTNVVTNTSNTNVFTYIINNLNTASYCVNNVNNYLYGFAKISGTGTFTDLAYQVKYTLPSDSRLLTYYDPGVNCNIRLGADFIAGNPSVGNPLNLTSAMSGSIIPLDFFGGAILQINLPTVQAGLNYKVIIDDGHLIGSLLTMSGSTGSLNGLMMSAGGANATISAKTNIILTNASANQTGSIVEFTSGGTTWAVRATVQNGSEWSFT